MKQALCVNTRGTSPYFLLHMYTGFLTLWYNVLPHL